MYKKWNLNENCVSKYLEACLDAVNHDYFFDNFKRDNRYTPILEHVGYEEASWYLKDSEKLISELITKMESIKCNDLYGNPIIYNFPSVGNLSGTTARYIKNCSDIIKFFKIENPHTIVEIGGGYGGLCKTIDSIMKFEEYYIYDLPQVNQLVKKYLTKFNLTEKVFCNDIDPYGISDKTKYFEDGEIDLLISNYAFSEVPLTCQLEYMEKLINKSKRFYMVYNGLSESSEIERGLTHEEFIDSMKDFNIKVEIEHRNHVSNYEGNNKILYGVSKNL